MTVTISSRVVAAATGCLIATVCLAGGTASTTASRQPRPTATLAENSICVDIVVPVTGTHLPQVCVPWLLPPRVAAARSRVSA